MLTSIVMTLDNRGYAALLLGQWARNHGIYEIRDVLKAASALAEQATSGEELGIALEQAAILKQAPVIGKQLPGGETPQAQEQALEEQAKPAPKPRAAKKAD